MGYDWSKFKTHVYIDRDVDDVFRAWATPEGLNSFFLKSAKFRDANNILRKSKEIVQAEDKYIWIWNHQYQLEGKIIETTDFPSITFTFGPMDVKVEIHKTENGSLVELTQFNMPHATEEERASNHLNCRSCWVFYMTNLKSVLENEIDLRESDPDKADCHAVHFIPPDLSK